MITKTYLDGRLDDLERKMEKKIDFKIGQAVQKREHEIAKLQNDLKNLAEKMNENREMDSNQDDIDERIISEVEHLKKRCEKMEMDAKGKAAVPEENNRAEENKNESDMITPDEI